MKQYFEDFKWCPKCGSKYSKKDFNGKSFFFNCKNCSFNFYQNSKPSISVIIPNYSDKSKILLTERAIEPRQGLLDIPSGFPIYGEDAIDSALREIKEELGIEIKIEKFLFTINQDYIYQRLSNNVIVIYFLAKPLKIVPKKIDHKENSNCQFYKISDIINYPEKFAFSSDFKAIKSYFEKLNI